MASVFQRGGRWYLRVKDSAGRWTKIPTAARTKTEARHLASELERRNERERLGLEPLTPSDGGGSLAELLNWWLVTVSAGKPSHEWAERTIKKHLLTTELAPLPLVAVSSERIEALLHRKSQEELSPQTINHLRAFLSRAFNSARRMGRYHGTNPVALVQKRRVPKVIRDILKPEEVGPMLTALAPRWRPLFATALYTGLRKGELLGLRKTEVDLPRRLLTVARSYDRDTTKGGHADVIPIAAELVLYLEWALATSPSELVFPAADGSMMRPDCDLEKVLRRAMARAGIVTGYNHVCRRPGCGHSEMAPDSELRRCPKDQAKLWPKPQVRPLRFHDMRHAAGSFLMMAGANPAAVQRILRHSDPRLTTERYGHLAPNYLRAEVDRLNFGSFVPSLSPGANPETSEAGSTEENSQRIRPLVSERRTGFEPATPSLGRSCEVPWFRQLGGSAGCRTRITRTGELGPNREGAIRVEEQTRSRLVGGKKWTPKNGRYRVVPLSPRAREIMADLRRRANPSPEDQVIPNVEGCPYVRLQSAGKGSGTAAWRVLKEAMGHGVRWHDLRHLFAARCLQRGLPIAVVSQWMGHSDVNLTVKRYGRFAAEAKEQFAWINALAQPVEALAEARKPRLEVTKVG